jgi:hypothetical protein
MWRHDLGALTVQNQPTDRLADQRPVLYLAPDVLPRAIGVRVLPFD